MAEVLYIDPTQKVVLHERPGATTVIVGFQFRRNPERALPPGKFPPAFIPDKVANSDIPAHIVSVIVNRNTWYLGPEAEAAVQTIRDRFPTLRLVTYGSSMGGYGAINLAPLLRADYTIAISPQATPFPPFADLIGDRRYVLDRPGLSQSHDRIATGISQDLRGLLFFDPAERLDGPHAARLASLTSLTLVGVPQSGHPCGPVLNGLYPLKQILHEVALGEPDVAAIRRALRAAELGPAPGEGGWLAAALDKALDPKADLSTMEPKFVATLAKAALEDEALLGEGNTRLERLITLIFDPRILWAHKTQRRDAALRMCCMLLKRRGARARALGLAKAHLPAAFVAQLRGEGPAD